VQFEGEEYTLSFVNDISDKVQARDELKSSQLFLESVIESIQDGVSVLDADDTIVHTNSVMREWYKESGVLVGQRCYQAFRGSDTHCDPCPTKRAFASGHTVSEIVPGLPGSGVEWLEVLSYPLHDQDTGDITGVVEFVRDISERIKIQKQLSQAQKMEAIGTLAGGIAHDFNNLLLGIQGRSSLMAVDLDTSHPHLAHIREIEEYIRSAANLTKQLLGVARGGKYEPKPLDLSALVVRILSMFGRTRKEISIHTKTPPAPVVVEVEKQQIEQVLLNIFINAWQAMPEGGDLFLEITVNHLGEADIKSHAIRPGRYARIAITDTGVGMDEASRQKVFDPFFTTKEKGRGTGLGLASAYGIIKNHGGFISVYSEVGHGSTFNIHLPLSPKEARRQTPAQERMLKGSETILLVDDEDLVLDVGQAMLSKLGYRVITAKGGKQAIATFKSRSAEIDLVILDLIMPDMDGGTTFDRIHELQPEMPVILSSGYAINGQATDILRRGCNGFIQKPFGISALSQKLREILDGNQ
jgi:signal transduction histidine kinase/CheY-like chemotaxis protein